MCHLTVLRLLGSLLLYVTASSRLGLPSHHFSFSAPYKKQIGSTIDWPRLKFYRQLSLLYCLFYPFINEMVCWQHVRHLNLSPFLSITTSRSDLNLDKQSTKDSLSPCLHFRKLDRISTVVSDGYFARSGVCMSCLICSRSTNGSLLIVVSKSGISLSAI